MTVKFEQRIDIKAPADVVWSIVTDPNKWPLWFPDIERVQNVSAVKSGGTFEWQKGKNTGSGAIVYVDAGSNRMRVVTRMGSSQVTHSFDVDRSGGVLGIGSNASRFQYTMEYDPPGGVIGKFVASGNPLDMLKVKQTLEKLKSLAEGQVGKS